MNIAEIGLSHMRDALTGKKSSCDVTEWPDDDGKPSKIYWLPPTGAQQIKIDGFSTEAERQAMTVKVRALDKNGVPIFADTAIESLMNDYDFDVIKTIAFLIVTNMGQEEQKPLDEQIEDAAKE